MKPLDDPLLEAALAARERAHCPYSDFAVGAALLTESGEVFSGCNVENASFGLTLCAERGAAAAAVAAGQRDWQRLVLVLDGGGSPCGACLQFLAEFAPTLPVAIFDTAAPQLAASRRDVTVDQLLPSRFVVDFARNPEGRRDSPKETT